MKMNLANKLTIFRVCLIPIFLFVFLGNFFEGDMKRYVATFIFAFASFTDFLDGYIARSRNQITNFGKFMDPLADKLLVCAALICLVGTGELSAVVVIIIISREFIVTGFRLVAASNNIVISAGWLGKIKTVLQMLMTIYLLLDLKRFGIIFEAVNTLLISLATIFTLISAIEYIAKNIKVLYE